MRRATRPGQGKARQGSRNGHVGAGRRPHRGFVTPASRLDLRPPLFLLRGGHPLLLHLERVLLDFLGHLPGELDAEGLAVVGLAGEVRPCVRPSNAGHIYERLARHRTGREERSTRHQPGGRTRRSREAGDRAAAWPGPGTEPGDGSTVRDLRNLKCRDSRPAAQRCLDIAHDITRVGSWALRIRQDGTVARHHVAELLRLARLGTRPRLRGVQRHRWQRASLAHPPRPQPHVLFGVAVRFSWGPVFASTRWHALTP